jgi:hypothetical protein
MLLNAALRRLRIGCDALHDYVTVGYHANKPSAVEDR